MPTKKIVKKQKVKLPIEQAKRFQKRNEWLKSDGAVELFTAMYLNLHAFGFSEDDIESMLQPIASVVWLHIRY